MRIENRQLNDFILDSNMLDKEKIEEAYQEAGPYTPRYYFAEKRWL